MGHQVSASYISIHALREEGDLPICWAAHRQHRFLSTPSARRATSAGAKVPAFFYISIHALREEGDSKTAGCRFKPCRISIHALREEGDFTGWATLPASMEFLSTPSARRATGRTQYRCRDGCHFYPRPPRGGRPD